MSDDEDQEMQDLFGSDSEEENGDKQPDFARAQQGRLRAKEGNADEGAQEEEGLEDEDADDGRAGRLDAHQRREHASGSDDDDDQDEQERKQRGPRRPERNGPPIEIAAPLLPVPASHDLHKLKLSNIITVEPTPFDPSTFQLEEEQTVDDQGEFCAATHPKCMAFFSVRRRQACAHQPANKCDHQGRHVKCMACHALDPAKVACMFTC